VITGDPKVGDHVYVRWRDSDPENEYDPAKIKSVNKDGTFQVTYFNADFSVPAATVAAQAAEDDPCTQFTDEYFEKLAVSEPEKIRTFHPRTRTKNLIQLVWVGLLESSQPS
jgi:hypothetical protein